MSIESRFLAKLQDWRSLDGESWEAATPSFQIQAFQGGKLKIDLAFGDRYQLYDWASLTKIVFSTTSAMLAVQEGDLKLSDRLVDWFPELEESSSSTGAARVLGGIRVRDLLSHSAGMTWWRPFYKTLDRMKSKDHEDRWLKLVDLVVRDAKSRAGNGELAEAKRGPAVYSDLDFFFLGEILRRSTLTGFSDRWAEIADRLRLEETWFHVEKPSRGEHGVRAAASVRLKTAPTEIDKRRGKRPVQGDVHDENTSSLLGIAPHAGLFGPIRELSLYGLELRKLSRGERSRLPEAGRAFLKRSVPRSRGDWGLGFMMPTKAKASCGPRFSLSSVGHTGFTGTSLWYDPKADILVTILSNRVCPTRKNTRFLQLRPSLHTMVVDSLD